MQRNQPRGQYAARELDDGGVVIYDTDNDDAWIRSDGPVALAWNT